MRINIRLPLPFALWLCVLWNAAALATDTSRSNPRAGIDYYLQTYGRVLPADVPDVYAVFEKVRAVADKSSLATAQLVVVGDTKQASAFSLSDGTIFLSKKALAIIRESATAEEARARLAFVLGHELAHLANNDFWDNQISQALLESSTASELTAKELEAVVDTSAGQQRKELKADDQGFLYAALAGYDVDTLLRSSRTNEDFLSFWNAKAGKRNDASYPLPAQRTSLLRLRLEELGTALQYFNFGARLMHFGRYREALGFFREFQKQFPGRELFNNIGYCHLRVAVNQLDPTYAYRYWLPMLSDLDTPLAKLTTRSADYPADRKMWRMSAAARESLLQAARNFELAIEKDAGYAPSYLNLATTQLLLGMDSSDARLQVLDGNNLLRAKVAIGSALKLQADDAQTQMLAEIIDLELRVVDKAANRNGYAETIAASSSAISDTNNPAVLYNLAQLWGNDAAKSTRYWQQLVNQFDTLPRKLQLLVCKRLDLLRDKYAGAVRVSDLAKRCENIPNNVTRKNLPWIVPAKLSRDLMEESFTESDIRQNAWQRINLANATVYAGPSNSVLAIDDIVTLVVVKKTDGSVNSLVQCCSQPLEKISVVNGTLWHYGRWIALVRESNVEEIWISN